MPLPKFLPEQCGFSWGICGFGDPGWLVGGADGRMNGMPLDMVGNSKKLAFWYWKLRRMDKDGVPNGLLEAIEKRWHSVMAEHECEVDNDHLRNMDINKPFGWDAW